MKPKGSKNLFQQFHPLSISSFYYLPGVFEERALDNICTNREKVTIFNKVLHYCSPVTCSSYQVSLFFMN
jgi:hypothetical protein